MELLELYYRRSRWECYLPCLLSPVPWQVVAQRLKLQLSLRRSVVRNSIHTSVGERIRMSVLSCDFNKYWSVRSCNSIAKMGTSLIIIHAWLKWHKEASKAVNSLLDAKSLTLFYGGFCQQKRGIPNRPTCSLVSLLGSRPVAERVPSFAWVTGLVRVGATLRIRARYLECRWHAIRHVVRGKKRVCVCVSVWMGMPASGPRLINSNPECLMLRTALVSHTEGCAEASYHWDVCLRIELTRSVCVAKALIHGDVWWKQDFDLRLTSIINIKKTRFIAAMRWECKKERGQCVYVVSRLTDCRTALITKFLQFADFIHNFIRFFLLERDSPTNGEICKQLPELSVRNEVNVTASKQLWWKDEEEKWSSTDIKIYLGISERPCWSHRR